MQPYGHLSERAARILWSVCDRLAAAADENAQGIAERIVTEIPEYGERFGDDDVRAGFVAAVRALVDSFPQVARLGQPIAEAGRAQAAAIAEQRAREGVSLAAITSALRIGFEDARTRVFGAFWGLPLADQDHDVLEALVAALDTYHWDVVDAFREGFGRVEDEERGDRHRARDAFLAELLTDEAPDPEEAAARATEVDAELSFPMGLVLVADRLWSPAPGHGRDPFPSRAGALARRLPRPVLGPVAIEHPGAETPVRCVLVPDLTASRARQMGEVLANACGDLDLAALHATVATLHGLSRTTERVIAASSVLDRLVPLVGPVTTPEALYGHRLADGLSLAEQDHELSTLAAPVMADPRMAEPHIATVRAMLEHGLVRTAAARELGVDRETVTERLKAISKLTGVPISDWESWRRWDTVCCLLDLYADVLPEPGAEFWRDREHGPSLVSLLM